MRDLTSRPNPGKRAEPFSALQRECERSPRHARAGPLEFTMNQPRRETHMSETNDLPTTRRSVLAGAIATTAALGATPALAQARKTFVLVHGAWHGGWCWRRVADMLEKKGHKVYTPTLTGVGERS